MSTSNSSRPNDALGIVALLPIILTATIFFAVIANRGTNDQQRIKDLADFVLKTGTPTILPAEQLVYFFLPLEDGSFYELIAPSKSGRIRAIQVRLRSDKTIDVL
jgi:hypothetical protein